MNFEKIQKRLIQIERRYTVTFRMITKTPEQISFSSVERSTWTGRII